MSQSGQSACIACRAGKYEAGGRLYCYFCASGKYSSAGWNSCKSCTNPISANEYWSSYGTTSTNCPQKACTNALNNNFYTASGGTTASSCKLGACVNALPAQYYPGPGGAVARVTNTSCPVANCSNRPLVGNYLSGAGGTSSTSCPQAKCSNALPSQYYVGSGTASILGSGTCPVANCSNQPLPYQYYSGPGGASAGTSNTSCPVAPCTNVPANFQYYSGHGGLNPAGCQVSTCANPLETGQYYSGFGFTSTGCQFSNCANKPPLNTLYAPLAVNLNSSCAWGCVGGFYWDAAAGACAGCPKHTYAPFNTVQSCIRCEAGTQFPNSTLAYLLDTTNNAVCDWRCVSGYFKYNGTCVDPLEYKPPPTTTTTTAASTTTTAMFATTTASAQIATTTAAAQIATTTAATYAANIFAVVIDNNMQKVRLVDLIRKTVQTIYTKPIDRSPLYTPGIAPDGTYALISQAVDFQIGKLSLSAPYNITTFAGTTAGNMDGSIADAKFQWPANIRISNNGSFVLFSDKTNYRVRKIDMATMQVSTWAGDVSGARDGVGSNAQFSQVGDLAIAPDDSFALATDITHNIRKIVLNGPANVTTIAGSTSGVMGQVDDFGTNARFTFPKYIVISPDQSMAVVSDYYGYFIRTINLATFRVQTVVSAPALLNQIGGLAFMPSGSELLVSANVKRQIISLFVSNWTFAYTIGQGGAYTAVDDTAADDPLNPQFHSPTDIAVWRCVRPGYMVLRDTSQCAPSPPPATTFIAPSTTAGAFTTVQPTTSTARPTTTSAPPTTTPPSYYVRFTLQTFALSATPELLGAYTSILAYLFTVDAAAIAMSTSTAPPPAVMRRRMRRRALLSYVPPPSGSTTSLLDAGSGGLTSVSTTPAPQVVEPDQMQDALIIYVTVSLQTQDQVVAITTLVNSAGFQDLLLAQCAAANLDAAYTLDFSMQIVNLFPTSTASAPPPATTAVPVPAPAPAPAPSEIVPQPSFSASPHAASPCLPLVAALVFAVLQVFN